METESLTLLRSDHNVAWYCRPRALVYGIVSRDAFLLRPGERFLSTNWLEYFHESERSVQISGVRAALAGKNFNVNPKGRFAVLNVGATIRQVRDAQLAFALLGQASDPSHARVFGYGALDLNVADGLALAVLELHPAAE